MRSPARTAETTALELSREEMDAAAPARHLLDMVESLDLRRAKGPPERAIEPLLRAGLRSLSALLLCAALIAGPASAAEGDLSAIGSALANVRSTKGANEMRDAGPELTPVKHALRAWVERQLPYERALPDGAVILPSPDDLTALSQRLSDALKAANLTCGDEGTPGDRCGGKPTEFFDARGFVGTVSVSALDGGRYMLAITEVGVRCGFDESVYIYRKGPDGHWTLMFQSEQDDYRDDKYDVQNFLAVEVSPANVAWNEKAPPPLVLTLGDSPWCSSNWNGLTTRLWRASDATVTPTPLMDRTDTLYRGDDEIASARLTDKDLLIEFRGDSIDEADLIRTHVLHFQIGPRDTLTRIAPVALNPGDFVEEWLTSDWTQSRNWSGGGIDKALWSRLHPTSPGTQGDFDGPATRCRSDHTLWQVGFAPVSEVKDARPSTQTYFLVRWMAPYRFTLLQTAPRKFPGCDQAVSMPDDIGTLFPIQDWTPH
jgi:hypothetical protein